MSGAGKQVSSQQLFERQIQKKSAGIKKSAPAILLADLSKSENIGAAYRLADAVGCETIYILNNDGVQHNQKTLQRISRSTIKSVNTISITLEDLKRICKIGPPMIAVEITDKSTSVLETQLPEKCLIVIGNEKYGVADNVLQLCTGAVHIPMFGINGSMNVSHALAIVLYEWRRQYH